MRKPPDPVKQKKFYRLHVIIYLTSTVGVLGLLFVLFLAGVSRGKLVWALFPVGVLLFRLGVSWRNYRKADDCEEVYDVNKRPPEEQIFMWRRFLWIMLILGPLIGYLTYRDLAAFASGHAGAVKLHPAEAILHDAFGFWGAVLCFPIATGAFALFAFYKMERAKAVLDTHAAEFDDEQDD